MKTVRLSSTHARALTGALRRLLLDANEERALRALEAALAPRVRKPMAVARLAAKESKREAKRAETAEIRATAVARAQGRCECGCGRFTMGAGELDHFFGRRKVAQFIRNCWMLHPICHRLKTRNAPAAAWWLESFARHCERYGYDAEAKRARQRIASLRDIATAAELVRHA